MAYVGKILRIRGSDGRYELYDHSVQEPDDFWTINYGFNSQINSLTLVIYGILYCLLSLVSIKLTQNIFILSGIFMSGILKLVGLRSSCRLNRKTIY